MNSEPQKIKLEREVESPSSPAVTSGLSEWVSPDSSTDQAIYREAQALWEQFLDSYRYRSAGHPVAIMIEEVNNSEEEKDLELAEELLQDPEFAQEVERESFAERQTREHLESLQRAVRAGTRKATLESHQAQASKRYKATAEAEEFETLADIATRAANTNFATTSVPAPVPDPGTAQSLNPYVLCLLNK